MKPPETVPSPLAGKEFPAHLRYILETDEIINNYNHELGLDVSKYFSEISQIGVYECETTSLKFFYPAGIPGDPLFYEQVEKRITGYYDENKWEHEFAANWVKPDDRVLDIGCGRGSFLLKARHAGGIVTGLETNKAATAELMAHDIEVVDELVDIHARNRPEHYDVVSAFQVLEHIADPNPFLKACKAALKPNGLLIIAVPNDDGFIGMDRQAILNGPPHHLTLWNRNSLTALAGVLGLTLQRIDVEPLNHAAWAQSVIEKLYVPKGWRSKLWYRLGASRVLRKFLEENAKGIAGHSIMATYQKI